MFILKLYDRLGQELNIGDHVKISDGHHFQFYSEVKYLESEECIAPFHTFCFHSFEKVDKIPENAILSTIETRYKCWYINNPTIDDNAAHFNHYLTEWRQCERLLEQQTYRIKLQKESKYFLNHTEEMAEKYKITDKVNIKIGDQE